MEKVVVQTGAKTYQITDQDGNDLGVFRFIPSDAGILKRYKEAAAFFTGINDKIKDKDFEEILPDLEKEAGEKIDLLFGAPVSESFFKITSPFTVLESGETFAEQIITVIGGIIEKELDARENSEMYDSMVQKLGEYGVSAEKATQILEQYGAQAGVSSAFVEEMTGKVQALGKGFSESSSTIDTSSITVKEGVLLRMKP